MMVMRHRGHLVGGMHVCLRGRLGKMSHIVWHSHTIRHVHTVLSQVDRHWGRWGGWVSHHVRVLYLMPIGHHLWTPMHHLSVAMQTGATPDESGAVAMETGAVAMKTWAAAGDDVVGAGQG